MATVMMGFVLFSPFVVVVVVGVCYAALEIADNWTARSRT